MAKFDINGNIVPLFPPRYVCKILGITKAGFEFKIKHGHIPTPNYRSETNRRLFSIEELAIIEYVYKEVWGYKQGYPVPKWVKELMAKAFVLSKNIVIAQGSSTSADDWIELDREFASFSRHRLQLYIDSWTRRLIDKNKFFEELVNE